MNLTVERVTAGYHGKTVIFDVDLALDAGETLCLLGPNGSGKTTLFKTILGLMVPTAGRSLRRRRRYPPLASPAPRQNPGLCSPGAHASFRLSRARCGVDGPLGSHQALFFARPV